MKLDQSEAQLIQQLRSVQTAKLTVVKHAGQIKSVRTEINTEIAQKAEKPKSIRLEGASVPRETGPNIVDTREGV